MKTCTFEGCDKRYKCKGLCNAHYRLLLLGKDLRPLLEVQSGCSVEGCDLPHLARGLCNKHYKRVQHHGNPHTVLPPTGCRLTGADHPRWKGDDISYVSAHCRVRDQRGKASTHQCECGAPAQEWAYDHSDPAPLVGLSRRSAVLYSPDIDRYQPMCGPCHRKFDKDHVGQVPA